MLENNFKKVLKLPCDAFIIVKKRTHDIPFYEALK